MLEQIYHITDPEVREGHDRFVRRFPADPRAKKLSMRLAELAFQRGDYLKSRNYAANVLKKTEAPGESFGGIELEANQLIVQGYLQEKAYGELIVFLEKRLSEFPDDESREEYESILALSYFQHGETLKNKGQALAAAEAYWKAYEYGAESETGPLALYEAGVLWDSSTTRQKAEDALHLFYVRYVESSLYYPVMMRLGALYHETGRSMKAAEIFEEASRLPISVALSHKVLDHAIELYEDAGLWEKVYLHAMKRAKEFQGRQVEERPFLVKAAEMKFKLGETAEAREILTDLISASEKDTPEQKVLDEEGGVPDYLAKAYFLLAESKIADFAEIKLVEPLDMNLQKKTRLFEDFLSEYRYAMVHPSPGVILNATHRIGEICEEFSRSLLRSARLPELTVEEAQMYDSFLKEQALSYIELAKEAYIENIELGKSMEVVNKWTEKSSRRLKRIYQIIAFNTLEQEFYP